MLKLLADFGLRMAGWPTGHQSTFFVGYTLGLFGGAWLLDHWLKKRVKEGHPIDVGKLLIPLYVATFAALCIAMFAVATAVKAVEPYPKQLAAAPAAGRDFVNMVQQAGVVGLALTLYFGYGLSKLVRGRAVDQ